VYSQNTIFEFPKFEYMQIPQEFYELTKEQQEEQATKMANKHYEEAEKWRRVSIQVRIGKIKPKKKN